MKVIIDGFYGLGDSHEDKFPTSEEFFTLRATIL